MWTPDSSIIKTATQKAEEAKAALLSSFQSAIQLHVDSVAQSRQYNDADALAGYVNSTIPQWATEATIFIAWRDAVWVFAYDQLDKVNSGEIEPPAVEDFISSLPVIDWDSSTV